MILLSLLAALLADGFGRGRAQELCGRLIGTREPPGPAIGERWLYVLETYGPGAYWLLAAWHPHELDVAPLSPSQADRMRVAQVRSGALFESSAPVLTVCDMPGLAPALPWLARAIAKLGADATLLRSIRAASPETRHPTNYCIDPLIRTVINPLRAELHRRGWSDPVTSLVYLRDWVRGAEPDLSRFDGLADMFMAAHDWHQRLPAAPALSDVARGLAGDVVADLGDPGGIGQRWTLHELKTRRQLDWEGEMLKHCVGGYAPDVRAGTSRIYSLRESGSPVLTIEMQLVSTPGGYPGAGMVPVRVVGHPAQLRPGASLAAGWRVTQVKGRDNRAPGDDDALPNEWAALEAALVAIGLDASPRAMPWLLISRGDDAVAEAIQQDPTLLYLDAANKFPAALYHGEDDYPIANITDFGDELGRTSIAWAQLIARDDSGRMWAPPEIMRAQIWLARYPDPTPEQAGDWDARDDDGDLRGPSKIPPWLTVADGSADLHGTAATARSNSISQEGSDPAEDVPISLVQAEERVLLPSGDRFIVRLEGFIYFQYDARHKHGSWVVTVNMASAITRGPDARDPVTSVRSNGWRSWTFHQVLTDLPWYHRHLDLHEEGEDLRFTLDTEALKAAEQWGSFESRSPRIISDWNADVVVKIPRRQGANQVSVIGLTSYEKALQVLASVLDPDPAWGIEVQLMDPLGTGLRQRDVLGHLLEAGRTCWDPVTETMCDASRAR